MEEDLVPPTAGPMADENRYDNVYDGDVKGRDPERHVYDNATYEMDTTAYDNATYELDTGEQTAVDMPPPPDELVDDLGNVDDADMPPSDEPYDDVVVDAEGDEHPAVIDVSTVDGDAMVEPDDEKEIDVADGDEEPPVYSAGSENTDLYAVPVKSRENSKKYDSVDGVPMTSAGTLSDEEQYRKEKSIKICICLFVIVLIGVIVGLVGFYAVYSMRELYATMNSPTTTTTKATEPPLPIMIDNIAVELNLTFNDFNFTEAYNDPNSTEYKELAAKVLKLLYDTLGSGNITVLEFRPGSIVAVVVIYFDEVPEALVDVLPENNVEVLVNAIGEELVILIIDGLANANESNVDVQIGNVIIEEVPTTVSVTTEASATGMTTETVDSTDGTTPTVDTTEEITTAFIDTTDDTTLIVATTGETTTPIMDTTEIVDTTRTDPTTTVETTTEATCPNGTFSCLEADGKCINNVQRCDFVPDCRVSRADETEELCQVSLLAEDVNVVFRRETTLTTPASYPIRDIDTPLDYILYRITSPPNSHILIELDMVTFSGVDSYLSIGYGHDPVQALYSNGILLTLSNEWSFPLATPDNQAYILLEKAQGENIEINIKLKAFVCNSEDAIPCRYSDQCYLPSEICDDTQQCQQGEDEEGCPNPLPPFCFNCSTPWENNTCLPSDWVCDETQDCLDNSDEIGCPTTEPCFECESDYGCVYLHWTCDGVEDCYDRADEMNCTDTLGCPNGTFECPEPESTCINSTQLCDFMPDCRATGSDETEDLCMVSHITEDVDVPFNAYRWLVTPNSYPSRDIDTPQDYYLYRLSSPSNSHMLLEIVDVIFTGPESVLTIGSGLDPVQAFYDSGLLLTFDNRTGWNASEPYRLSTPVNEAYVLLEKAPGENLEITIRLSAFECTRPGDIPCSYSNNCYLVSEICDGTVQCTGSQEDELDCSSPTPPFCFNCSTPWENNTCLPYDWVCDGAQDCLDNSDEIDCPTTLPECFPCNSSDCVDWSWVCDGWYDCYDNADELSCNDTDSSCFPCYSDLGCVIDFWVCDGTPHCFNGLDEQNCNATTPNTTEPLCFDCDSNYDCINSSWVCDGVVDCYFGQDEFNCNDSTFCGADQYPCPSDYRECFNASDVCDGMYDCPGGGDEYNCTGCFACPGSSNCLIDFQICNFFNDCPGGEDEAESLCDHSSFITDIQVNVGEWMTFNKGYVSERHPGRHTPASNFYDFTHYVFRSDPGTTLFVEIQNMTISLSGLLLPFVRVSAGSGPDPTDFDQLRAFADGYGNQYSISNTFNFSLTNNTGNLLIALPTAVFGSFYVQFRVTAIECESPETLCIGSPHCYDWFNDTCDGEVQCLDSGEDEYGCEAGNSSCFFCEKSDDCIPWDWVCDGSYDCYDASDELNCNTTVLPCFQCTSDAYQCIDLDYVCDNNTNCDDGSDEWNCNPSCFNCTNIWNNATCLPENWICDGLVDCVDESDELFCPPTPPPTEEPSSCFNCTSPYPCVFEPYWVCNGIPECFDDSDEANCNTTTTTPTNYTCLDCQSDYCVLEEYRCDSILDCFDGLDEMNCICEDDQLECYYEETCVQLNETCDGYNDCPGGVDEYNCTGCFSCPGSSDCLYDLQVCDFYNHCPGGEDEAESLCNHLQFINNVQVPTGEWVTLKQQSGGAPNRGTPASDFIEFTHYVFDSDPGTTLFMELLNYTWSDGPLVPLLVIYAGAGDDPTYVTSTTAYLDGTGYSGSISYSNNFSLLDSTGFGLVAFPKGVDAYVELRVTAIACVSPETACIGSPHCVNWANDTCDGEAQCLYNQEDEFNCDGCDLPCFFDNTSCLYYDDYCDGEYDCKAGEDEYGCPGCFTCPGSSECILDSVVCDFYDNCYGGEDEAESLCRDSEFIIEKDVPTGEWVTIEQRSGDPVENRGTPASKFYDFYHYVFNSVSGTTLFVELQNYTWSSDASPVLPLLRIIAGAGNDPASGPGNRAYFDSSGYSYTISNSPYFSLTNNTGFVALAFPKGVEAYVKFRVTAIACESPETLCNGSPHCVDWTNDTCDGEAQCIDSQEDELNCPEPCFDCTSIQNNTCVPTSWVCDGIVDCVNETDEVSCQCETCFVGSECLPEAKVCDFYFDCPLYEDESEELCQYSAEAEFYSVTSGQPLTVSQPTVYPFTNNPDVEYAVLFFTSTPGTSLFVELQNFLPEGGDLARIQIGSGHDPGVPETTHYFFLPFDEEEPPVTTSLTVEDNKAYVVIGRPAGYSVNVTLKVTEIDACNADQYRCQSSGECILSEFVCNLKQECTNVDDEKSCGYDLISTDVSLGSEQYEVNSVVPVAVGDNIPAALWRFYAPNSSYALFFDVSSSYTLPDNSEAGIGPGTDFIGGRTATYYSWGSITPASKHDFYVPSHEAFVSISIPDESASVSLSFSVTAVQAPDCTGDSSVCVICVPRNQQCVLGLGCSTGTEYFCP